jgi:hypothetical protein
MRMNVFLNIFFNRGMKLQIPKKSPGGTKCTYEVLASQTKNKKESHKHQLKWGKKIERTPQNSFSKIKNLPKLSREGRKICALPGECSYIAF